jgi:hypothetical protein
VLHPPVIVLFVLTQKRTKKVKAKKCFRALSQPTPRFFASPTRTLCILVFLAFIFLNIFKQDARVGYGEKAGVREAFERMKLFFALIFWFFLCGPPPRSRQKNNRRRQAPPLSIKLNSTNQKSF